MKKKQSNQRFFLRSQHKNISHDFHNYEENRCIRYLLTFNYFILIMFIQIPAAYIVKIVGLPMKSAKQIFLRPILKIDFPCARFCRFFNRFPLFPLCFSWL